MPRFSYTKDPDSVLDYGFDWSEYLPSDVSITSSSWSVTPSGEMEIVAEFESFSAQETVVEVSGGESGTVYRLTNHIGTDGAPSEVDRSHLILVRER